MKNNALPLVFCVLICSSILFSCRGSGTPTPDIITLDRLDLYLADGTGTLDGNIIVQVRDAAGNTPAITETLFAASDLKSDIDHWHTVAVSNCTLSADIKYRIYVRRSIADPGGIQSINWNGNSSSGIDLYPEGQNDWAVTAAIRSHCDYGFRTYDNGTVDQSMETSDYSFVVMTDDTWKWQEFVAGAN